MVHHIFYNSFAANRHGKELSEQAKGFYPETDEFIFHDLTEIKDVYAYICALPKEDHMLITGGDGTLNRFANSVGDHVLDREVWYLPCGTGNDFYVDIKGKDAPAPILLNPYLEDLPVTTVKGKSYRFLNGIGYGIDGYCCEVGDKLKAQSDKPVNYTSIAIKGLLFHYKPTNAKITVDGKVYTYKKVWLAPTMNGRFFGGGMMITPNQDRLCEDGMLSVAVGAGCGKLKILTVFPGVFKGTHVKHTEIFNIMRGHDITVEFDRPTPLQIDGETVLDVLSVHSISRAKVKEQKKEAVSV